MGRNFRNALSILPPIGWGVGKGGATERPPHPCGRAACAGGAEHRRSGRPGDVVDGRVPAAARAENPLRSRGIDEYAAKIKRAIRGPLTTWHRGRTAWPSKRTNLRSCALSRPGIRTSTRRCRGVLGGGRARPASARAFSVITTAFPDVHITAEELIREGDKVALRWTLRGTQFYSG